MKRMIRVLFSVVLLQLLTTGMAVSYGQGREIDRTFSWNKTLNSNESFRFVNYDCDLVINTWDRQEVKYEMTVDASLSSEEDTKTLEKYIESLQFTSQERTVTFENRFWNNRVNIAGRKTMTLDNKQTIRYSEFNMKGELWIPAGVGLELESKYSRIEMGRITGMLTMDLYNDKIYGNDCGTIDLTAKYSTIELKNISDIKADIYDTDIYTGNMGRLGIVSKYSTVNGKVTGDQIIDSYNDKFSFESTGVVEFISKYSDFKSGKTTGLVADSYEGSIIIDEIDKATITSKYTKFTFINAGNCIVRSAYNSRITAGSMNSIAFAESKYGTYEFNKLAKSFSLAEGYDDKIIIGEVMKGFTGLKAEGKYVKTNIGLSGDTDFRFKADIKYPKLEMNEEALTIRIKIVESSQLKYEAVMGTEKQGMPLIEINGYEMALKINEL